tara:strand:+ start:318 stop:635 length:318 start_codon:yes stop_codon:yes gene_type:complete
MVKANAVDMDELTHILHPGGMSRKAKIENVKKAYAAAVKLDLIDEDEFKVEDFVEGKEEAIISFLSKLDGKYSLHQLVEKQAEENAAPMIPIERAQAEIATPDHV